MLNVIYKHTLLVSFGSISGLTLRSGCTMNRHFRILDATINLRWSSAIFTFRKWAPHKKSSTTNSQPTTRGRAKAAWLVIGSYRDLQSPEEWDVMAAQSDGTVAFEGEEERDCQHLLSGVGFVLNQKYIFIHKECRTNHLKKTYIHMKLTLVP